MYNKTIDRYLSERHELDGKRNELKRYNQGLAKMNNKKLITFVELQRLIGKNLSYYRQENPDRFYIMGDCVDLPIAKIETRFTVDGIVNRYFFDSNVVRDYLKLRISRTQSSADRYKNDLYREYNELRDFLKKEELGQE